MNISKKIILGIGIVLIGIQFIRIDKSIPSTEVENNIIEYLNISNEVATILKTSCYDCHSNETVYPWYSNVAPVSWWVQSHIDHAREEMNFSEWGTYSEKRVKRKLEEIIEELYEGEMPLKSYLIVHRNSKLEDHQMQTLVTWAKNELKSRG